MNLIETWDEDVFGVLGSAGIADEDKQEPEKDDKSDFPNHDWDE